MPASLNANELRLSTPTWGALSATSLSRPPHTGPTVGCLKHLERLGRGQELIHLACSAASEAFGTTWTTLDPTEHAKSQEEGRWTSEPLDSLIGCVPAEWPF